MADIRVPRETVNDDSVRVVRWLASDGDVVRAAADFRAEFDLVRVVPLVVRLALESTQIRARRIDCANLDAPPHRISKRGKGRPQRRRRSDLDRVNAIGAA
jgi:hypothetical protein